ncbi:MAG: permease-like cell division protein FtsX [Prevotella sp.]|nr:permease-like cell division protein FtsX [Prevotella sp.]
MEKRQKTTRRHQGMQAVTLCISTTMVLTLLGLVVLTVFTTRNLSNYVRENLTVTVMLGDSVTAKESVSFAKDLGKKPYAKKVVYISKEQALKEQTEAMGSDPSEFLGVNPFVATIELNVNADYANSDSLRRISKQLKRNKRIVTDVAYQEDLTESVNNNLQKASVILLALAVLLIIVSYSLISNSVRLDIYSRRFSIHTMKLVGASWGFIRRPFLSRAIGIGLVASLLACGVLGGVLYALYRYQPGVEQVIGVYEMSVTAAAVFASGLVIMLFCTFLSVNKFLRMKAGELYKI